MLLSVRRLSKTLLSQKSPPLACTFLSLSQCTTNKYNILISNAKKLTGNKIHRSNIGCKQHLQCVQEPLAAPHSNKVQKAIRVRLSRYSELATGWTVRGSNPGGGRGGARLSTPVQAGPRTHPASCIINSTHQAMKAYCRKRDITPLILKVSKRWG